MPLKGSTAPYWVKSFWGLPSPGSPTAPFCWVFCLPPRERVGPAGLCAQRLGGKCSVPGASGVGPQAADRGAHPLRTSGMHSPGAVGVGAQEAEAAVKSLNSCWVPLFSFSFWEIPPIQAPLYSNKHLVSRTAQPGSLPRVLQHTLPPEPGASAALVPALVPGTLLSLSTLLTIWSFNVLYLWSLIFIYAGIPLAVPSVPQKIS